MVAVVGIPLLVVFVVLARRRGRPARSMVTFDRLGADRPMFIRLPGVRNKRRYRS